MRSLFFPATRLHSVMLQRKLNDVDVVDDVLVESACLEVCVGQMSIEGLAPRFNPVLFESEEIDADNPRNAAFCVGRIRSKE